jgi:serine/threonine-protein kinase
MLDQHQQIMLVDFGLATAFHPDFEDLYTSSAEFIAPEVFLGQDSPISDIYSLGVCLRSLLTAESAHSSEAAKSDEVRPELQANLGLPPDLEACIKRATQSDPASRYQSAADMKTDLLAILGRSESRQQAPQYDQVAPMP